MNSKVKNKLNKTSPDSRVIEFPNNGLKVVQKKLWCECCLQFLNHEKLSVIKLHLKSATHCNRKGVEPAPKLNDRLDEIEQKKERWSSMATTFASVGVPLHVFRIPKFRNWIITNVKNGSTLPCETKLRDHLVVAADDDHAETVKICDGKDVVIIVDETLDIKNRKLLNILISPAGVQLKPRLATSKILKRCTAATVVDTILNTLQSLNVPRNKLICLISDNARYMVAAGVKLKAVCERFMHSTCWAHCCHLVSEQIREKLKVADLYISKFKACLVKAPARREELLDALEKFKFPRTLPPVPVITRWTTWLETGSFHLKHLDAEIEWIRNTEDSSDAVTTLKSLVNNSKLQEELQLISDIYPGLSSCIKIMETRSTPASDVWLTLKTMEGLYYELLGEEDSKLENYISNKHPARLFWKDVQYLDPRKAEIFVKSGNEAMPASLTIFSTVPVPKEEIIRYKFTRETKVYLPSFCPFSFWNENAKYMPILSALAIAALSVPCSSADVERSFSLLRRTLTPGRNRFTPRNLEIHLKLQYNQTDSNNQNADNETDDGSDFELLDDDVE